MYFLFEQYCLPFGGKGTQHDNKQSPPSTNNYFYIERKENVEDRDRPTVNAGWKEIFEPCTFHLTQSYVFSMYWLFCSLCLPLKIICLPSSRQMIFIYLQYIFILYIYIHPLYTWATTTKQDQQPTRQPKPWWWVWYGGIHPNPHRPELFSRCFVRCFASKLDGQGGMEHLKRRLLILLEMS